MGAKLRYVAVQYSSTGERVHGVKPPMTSRIGDKTDHPESGHEGGQVRIGFFARLIAFNAYPVSDDATFCAA
jgi:hypothetical protein